MITFLHDTMRGRAVVARRAHNPEAVGSNPTPAISFARRRSSVGKSATLVMLRSGVQLSPAAFIKFINEFVQFKLWQRKKNQTMC